MIRIIILLISLLLTGCVSGYQHFYIPYVDAKSLPDVELLGKDDEPNMYGTDNFDRDIKILASKRYILVGHSSFNGTYESENNAKAQARRIGATVILVKSEYTNTQTTTTPLFLPNTTTTYHSGTVYGGGVYGGYSGTSTTYGSSVVPITTSQRMYDQTAVFLVKSNQKIKFGVYVFDLTNEMRVELERNKGAFIDVVVENTPAFNSNVLSGDVLIEIDGTIIKNAQHALEIMKSYDTSKDFSLWKVVRKGEEKEIRIKFQ